MISRNSRHRYEQNSQKSQTIRNGKFPGYGYLLAGQRQQKKISLNVKKEIEFIQNDLKRKNGKVSDLWNNVKEL